MQIDVKDSTNINFNQCVKSVSHVGYDTYINICNGTSYTLQWGILDYLLLIFLVTLVGGLALFVLCAFWSWLTD
jgi:hypothetical protein